MNYDYDEEVTRAAADDQSTSKFTRDIIRAAIKRDPVDVANELQVLADMFSDRADRLLEERLRGSVSRLQGDDDK